MTTPYVGLPTVGTGCAYSVTLDAPACGAPAVTHMLVIAAGWGAVALVACADHTSLGLAAGEVLGDHPYGDGCRAAEHLNTHWSEP